MLCSYVHALWNLLLLCAWFDTQCIACPEKLRMSASSSCVSMSVFEPPCMGGAVSWGVHETIEVFSRNVAMQPAVVMRSNTAA